MIRQIVMLLGTAFVMLHTQAQKNHFIIRWDDNGAFALQQYASNIYKITYQPRNYHTNENVSDAVVLKPRAMSKVPMNVVYNDKHISISKLAVILNGFSENGYNGLSFLLQPGEEIYGGGERAININRRGFRFNLHNNPWYGYGEGADNLNYSVPFFMSNKGYGLFFDNPSSGFVDIGKENEKVFKAGFVSGEINVYIIMGKNLKEVLAGYTKLTGTQPLPPKWAMGNLMSRFGYTSEEQAKDIYNQMKSQHIPVDAIIFDLFWFGDSIKGTLGNLDWVNREKWPDPKGMITDFKKQGVNTILVTEPFVVNTSANFELSRKFHSVDKNGQPYLLTDFYFGYGGLIDIFRKDAQDWFWSKHQPQMDKGVEAWWGDLGEPEKHPRDLYHNLKDMGYNRLFAADEVHNIYGHNWTKMLFNKYAKYYPEKRLFSLNRSGFAGSQRYSIFPWSGDVSRSWSGYRAQLPLMLGMSMSGIPYVHADAGGFAGGDGDNELYVRWLQFAAFTPIFRPHGTALYEVDRQAYSFPSEAALIQEPYRTMAKKYINMRYKLLPYNYTLAYKQASSGVPLVAPMNYHYPGNNVQDQYMWGENIMVAPILEKGRVERLVKFPIGKWYQLHTSKPYTISANIPAPLETMPVFAKEGSFISLAGEDVFSTTKDMSRDIVVEYYFSKNSSANLLYDDDGVSKSALSSGKYELLQFSMGPASYSRIFTIKSLRNGTGQAKRNIKFKFYGKKYNAAIVNGQKVMLDNTSSESVLPISFSGKTLTIQLM